MSTQLIEYLERVLDRAITREELAVSLGMSVATVDRRRNSQFSLDEKLKAIDYFNLSRTDALVAWGVLELGEVMDSIGADGKLVDSTSTVILAEEVARRLREAAGDEDSYGDRFPVAVKSRSGADTQNARLAESQARLRKGLLE